jgi:GMP synthase-like glutamine amidotransferase
MGVLIVISSTQETYQATPQGFNVGLVVAVQTMVDPDVYYIGDDGPIPDIVRYQRILISGSNWRLSQGDVKSDVLARYKTILCHAQDLKVPVLGICFGAQIITEIGGGTIQASTGGGHHLRNEKQFDILVQKGTFLDEIPPNMAEFVRSHHYDNICTLPVGFVRTGQSVGPDGMTHIAAFEGNGLVGTQFHLSSTDLGQRLLLKFIRKGQRLFSGTNHHWLLCCPHCGMYTPNSDEKGCSSGP